MKVIFWGANAVLQAGIAPAAYMEIQAILDENPQLQGELLQLKDEQGRIWLEKPVLSPYAVVDYSFDYLVVFETENFLPLYQRIMALGVEPGKIVHFQYYIQHVRDNLFYELYREQLLLGSLEALQADSVLDMDCFLAAGPRCSRDCRAIGALGLRRLDGCAPQQRTLFPLQRNLYNTFFADCKDIPKTCFYDTLVFTRYRSFDEYKQCLVWSRGRSRQVLFFLPPDEELALAWQQFDFSDWGQASWKEILNGAILLVEQKNIEPLKVYIVQHCSYTLPPHETCYVPIQAGRASAPSLGITGDDTGQEISYWNPFLNELTVLYWIWKNTVCPYVGLVHYRRYLLAETAEKKLLPEKQALQLLQEYDILLGDEWVLNCTQEIQLAADIGQDLYTEVEAAFSQLLQQRQPSYLAAYHQVMTGCGFYRCNMFITRWEIFDRYADWLFSFLPEVLPKLDLLEKTPRQKRAVGFFAERMLTVWLLEQDLRIKELPIWGLEG